MKKINMGSKRYLPIVVLGGMFACSQASGSVFQAEDYKYSKDLSSGNTGQSYRSGNVDIQSCRDEGGGFNVGWTEKGEWLTYEGLNIPQSGHYIVNVRVASNAGGKLSVDLNGGDTVLGQFDIPNTGGWQEWKTVSKKVYIDSGHYDLGVWAVTGGWNLNWIEVKPAKVDFNTTFQAEDYSYYKDMSSGNNGRIYRSDDVDIEVTSDTGGGYNVGWTDAGEWLSYKDLKIPEAGTYKVSARVASPIGGALSLDLNGGGVRLGQLDIPKTGGWQNWVTVSKNVRIDAGTYDLGLWAVTGGWNVNWIKVESSGDAPPPEASGRSLVWSDEFNAINHNDWNFETGDNVHNNELQWYAGSDNARIEYDGQVGSNVLVIEAKQETGGPCWHGGNCGYTSVRMNTHSKHSFKYGRIEARMKLPRTQGIWPAFWMLGDDFANVGWPEGGEIDIMEHVNDNDVTTGALHGPGYSGETPINGHINQSQNISDGYHVYAIEWDSQGIRWYVDGNNFYSVTKAEVERHGRWVYDQPFWLLLNVAVGGNWPGDPDHQNYTTQRLYVDYVRVYSQ